MKKFFCLVAVFFVMSSILLTDAAFARPRPRLRRRAVRGTVVKPVKKYNYVKAHDLNGDGKVNAGDRYLWVKRRGTNVAPVILTVENIDIYEIMDLNNDGKVTQKEMELYLGSM